MKIKQIIWPSVKDVIKSDKKIIISIFAISFFTLSINFLTNFIISLF